ncbi:YceI family protein [Myroides odoratus]|uniref:YceI family protein n=1 Tax=Myroides odoratus TaxID=256 RepID=UPI0007658403|nr:MULTISPECIES: YceI family protein [Myroides]WHT39035.1 YceI family protein [Myroides sp. mNGS23_01]
MKKSIWVLDPTHSEIGFKVKYMMFTNIAGKFTSIQAVIENENDNFETSTISFTAEANSIDTNNGDRDKHLRSAEFFDVENYPKLSFKSTKIEKNKEGEYTIHGDLTIKDQTQRIVLAAAYSGLMKDPWGNTKAGISLTGKINRKEFGLTWNSALETGGVLVGDDIQLMAEIQLIRK